MWMEAFAHIFQAGSRGNAFPVGKCTALQEKSEQSPLEAAQQALQRAKDQLEAHRDERMESAVAGYQALRSRQTSYEGELRVQQEQNEAFQTLSSQYDALSGELSAAKAEAASSPPDLALSRRVSALEGELEAVDQSISALVDQANRYARGQRQYADYLENSGQGGYAAYVYRERGECTRETFLSENGAMLDRLEAGSEQWRERVSAYCAQYGKTPYDFESYLQERRQLSSAYFAAQQRVSELLHGCGEGQEESRPAGAARFDTVEISHPLQQMPDTEEENH